MPIGLTRGLLSVGMRTIAPFVTLILESPRFSSVIWLRFVILARARACRLRSFAKPQGPPLALLAVGLFLRFPSRPCHRNRFRGGFFIAVWKMKILQTE